MQKMFSKKDLLLVNFEFLDNKHKYKKVENLLIYYHVLLA
jgi:hypothetical protein